MKFISWNVNGIRACMGKGFMDFFNTIDADIFCLQETKMQEGQLVLDLPGTMRKRKATPEPHCSPAPSQSASRTAWALRSTIKKGA